jgi:hypothetical protein
VEGWTDTTPGYRTKTIKRGNVTIVINRPILSEKERTKSERIVENALTTYARSYT